MFLSVEWAKRWLPAVFLLLSLLLPWWTIHETTPHYKYDRFITDFTFSFLWMPKIFFHYIGSLVSGGMIHGSFNFYYNQIPSVLFASISIVAAGLCGLGKNRTRTLGGFLGIIGMVTYFVFIFPLTLKGFFYLSMQAQMPYFGISISTSRMGTYTAVWFLSPGFFLALAGSLMLLSPIIRTGIERIRKRPSSSKQPIKEPILIDVNEESFFYQIYIISFLRYFCEHIISLA